MARENIKWRLMALFAAQQQGAEGIIDAAIKNFCRARRCCEHRLQTSERRRPPRPESLSAQSSCRRIAFENPRGVADVKAAKHPFQDDRPLDVGNALPVGIGSSDHLGSSDPPRNRYRAAVNHLPAWPARLTDWSLLYAHFHISIYQGGSMSDVTIPGGKIRAFVERIENLDTEMLELSEQKKEVFAEAKGEGFDVKILKEIVKLRKQDQDERDERESMLDLYMRAMEQAGPEKTAKAA
jgi:uncharacterized protein (UPF0335 family)